MTASGKAVFLVGGRRRVEPDAAGLADGAAHRRRRQRQVHVRVEASPDGNTDQPAFQQIYNLVTSHKYTLFLTGHSHEYKHYSSAPRAVVMGLGGAPFDNPNQQWWGYMTVMQCPDDRINVAVYDQATGNVQDQFSVPPQ